MTVHRDADVQGWEALIRPILEAAGDEALRRLRDPIWRIKPDGSKITEADLAAHEVLCSALSAAVPGERLISEEDAVQAPPKPPASGAVWYIDPLDGTGAYTEGLAHWGPTVARVVDGKLDVGAFWVPRLREWWFAAAGRGAWRDGARLRPADPAPDDPNNILFLPSHAHHIGALAWPGRTRGLGSTAAHMALVASGGAAAAILPKWSLWDVGAGVLLVQEANRQVVDLSGAPFDPMNTPTPILAAAPGVIRSLSDAVQMAIASRGNP